METCIVVRHDGQSRKFSSLCVVPNCLTAPRPPSPTQDVIHMWLMTQIYRFADRVREDLGDDR